MDQSRACNFAITHSDALRTSNHLRANGHYIWSDDWARYATAISIAFKNEQSGKRGRQSEQWEFIPRPGNVHDNANPKSEHARNYTRPDRYQNVGNVPREPVYKMRDNSMYNDESIVLKANGDDNSDEENDIVFA